MQGPEFFTEPEVWYIMDSLINACSYFESCKIYHGDIRPINVLLTKEGQVKIADNGLINQSKNGNHLQPAIDFILISVILLLRICTSSN